MLSKKIGMLFTFLDSALLPQLLNGLYGEGGDGMSVLIDMDMPKVCNECPFCCNPSYFEYAWCELLQQHFDMDESYNKVADFCPITEVPTPHGRLIDETFEENHYASMLLDSTPDVTKEDKRNARVIIDALRMAKVVIETEGETDGR